MTLDGQPTAQSFIGRRGGLPTTKARLQAMARSMGLNADGMSVAQLRSAIIVGLGRSDADEQQRLAEERRDRSRSQRQQRRTNQQRSDERRQQHERRRNITALLQSLVDGAAQIINIPAGQDNSMVLETILQAFPNTRFLVGTGGRWLTVTPENVMRLLDLMRSIREGEFDQTAEGWGKKSDAELASWVQEADLQVKLAPISRTLRSTGGFFKHINLTHFDLSHYGVYQKEEDIVCEDNCLFVALKHGGFPEKQLDDLRVCLRTRDIPEYKLKEVCEKFSCRMRVSKKERTVVYGKEGTIYNLGLLDEHYFINETTEMTAFTIQHYDDTKDLPECHRIRAKEGKKWKRTQGDHFSKSFHILEKLLQSSNVRPIEYSDAIMATTFYDKFRKKKDIVLKDIPESNFKKEEEKKKPPTKTVLRYFFDFETCPDEKNEDGSNANHSSYGVSVHFSDEEKQWFEGEDHVEKALRWMTNSVCKKTKGHLKKYKVLMLAHNLSYDIRFLMDKIGCRGILPKGSKTLTANCFRSIPVDPGYIDFMLKDTACMITMPLSKFGKCFNLPTEKDVMPYKLYTKANVVKRICTVEEAHEVFRKDGKEGQIPQFDKNLEKLNLIHNGFFDIMAYARYYCEKDTEVLCKGYEKFRDWILEALDIDIDSQVTISSVARTYLQNRGCFNEVEQMGGITREFHKQFVVGGRVMTRENKKVHARCKISDYDAVSLYPSAMARMPGFLKGRPKVLQPEQLNKEFLDQQDGYFVHARIKKVGIRRAFPLMTEFKEDGTRTFDNDVEEVYVDKTGLEDLIDFQQCELEILDGVYYNEGRNTKISEVMRELFQLRKQKKAEGNPIQEVYKLIMNSGYGFTIMKAPEYDLQIKNRDEADTYIARNYGAIHSIVEVGSNKTLVKTHKAIEDHYVPIHCGIEVLSWSKRIMNETMCLAEDIGIPIYYQDTDSMHMPEKDVPRMEAAFLEKYGRQLNGKDLGQFHPDFEFDGHRDVRSVELIACGKKCYLDVLEGENKDGVTEQTLHVRMKGVPTQVVEWTARSNPDRIQGVRELYIKLLNGEEVEFDLTARGTRPCFDSARDFTVKSREKFDRNVKFRNPDVLYF